MNFNLTCFCLTADHLYTDISIFGDPAYCLCLALEAAYCTESFDLSDRGLKKAQQ